MMANQRFGGVPFILNGFPTAPARKLLDNLSVARVRIRRSAAFTTDTCMARSPRTSAAPRRARKTSAQPAWAEGFLAELANSSNVTAAARKCGIQTSVAYEHRRRDRAFYSRWQVALCEGYDNLEMELLHRLRSGEVRAAPATKKSVRAFDNGTAFRLLAAHRESAARQRAIRDSEDSEAVLARIDAKLARMRDRTLALQDGDAGQP